MTHTSREEKSHDMCGEISPAIQSDVSVVKQYFLVISFHVNSKKAQRATFGRFFFLFNF